MKKFITVLLIFILSLTLLSCDKTKENPDVSENGSSGVSGESTSAADETASNSGVLYTEDTTLGEGEKTVTVKITGPDSTVTFTVKTDAENLGEVLTQNNLVEGEKGPYGLYIKKANGISGVYETDGAYWALFVGGKSALTGADGIEITDGGLYELTYTKAD